MIDFEFKVCLAELLHQFVAGRLTNDEFADRLPRSEDHAVREINRKSGICMTIFMLRMGGCSPLPPKLIVDA